MFCPECGTKNDDSALFCENCGAKMNVESEAEVDNTTENVVTTENSAEVTNSAEAVVTPVTPVVGPTVIERKPLSKKTKMILIGATALVVVILIFVGIGKSTTNPDKIASKYFEDVAAGRWEEVYDYYELSENDFVNKEMYKRAVKNKEKIEYSNYAIKQSGIEQLEDMVEEAVDDSNEAVKKDDDLYKTIYIQYVGKNSESTNSTYVVKLFKTSKKKMLFFDNWKVVPEDMLTKNYVIRTLDGIEVSVDGKKLSDKYLVEKESSSEYEANLKEYKIPSIFKGKHTIKLKGEYIDEHEEKVELTAAVADSFSYTNPSIKKSFIEELETNSKDIVNKLYQGAIADKKINELELPYEISKDNEEDVEERYESICDAVDNTSYGSEIALKEFTMKDFKVSDANSYIDSGSIAATISYRATYKGKFVKSKDGKKENKTDEKSISGTITYKYIDSKWQITRMYASDIYYYWY